MKILNGFETHFSRQEKQYTLIRNQCNQEICSRRFPDISKPFSSRYWRYTEPRLCGSAGLCLQPRLEFHTVKYSIRLSNILSYCPIFYHKVLYEQFTLRFEKTFLLSTHTVKSNVCSHHYITTQLVLVFQFIYKHFHVLTWICKVQICVFIT